MGEIKKQVNVIFYEDTNEIIINSDQGRARRPAIIVENGKPLVTPDHIERLKKRRSLLIVLQMQVDRVSGCWRRRKCIIAIDERIWIPNILILRWIRPWYWEFARVCTIPEHNASPRNTMGAAWLNSVWHVNTEHEIKTGYKSTRIALSPESAHFDPDRRSDRFWYTSGRTEFRCCSIILWRI